MDLNPRPAAPRASYALRLVVRRHVDFARVNSALCS